MATIINIDERVGAVLVVAMLLLVAALVAPDAVAGFVSALIDGITGAY